VEAGYLYIAQPPLFKAKRGKTGRYLKDEPALEEYLLDLALRHSNVRAGGSPTPVEEATLREMFRKASTYQRVLDRMRLRLFDDRLLDAAVHARVDWEAQLADSEALLSELAPRLAAEFERRVEVDRDLAWSLEDGGPDGTARLVARTRRNGGALETSFDLGLVRSSDFQRMLRLYEESHQLAAEPYELTVDSGDPESFPGATGLLARILEVGRKGISIQRYKGLGEMNPDQLAETTMQSENRSLLQVRVDDAVEADEVFTTLMGDVVEPRRQFIEDNALNVENLDI
jgi:DNA gyrase subunit B